MFRWRPMPPATPARTRSSLERVSFFGVSGGVGVVGSDMTTMVRSRAAFHHWESPLGDDGAMFERFTPSARQVIVFAQEEARLLRHNAIGTEHLLIGLLRDDVGHGGAALRSFGLSAEAAAARVAEIVPAGGAVTGGQIPYTPRAR